MKTREERRIQFHKKLCEILGSENCYFSPPDGLHMKYPCIVYELSRLPTRYADNKNYIFGYQGYTVEIIDADPDSELIDKLRELPMCSFDRFFVSDNLNHFVFTIYH